MHKDHAQVSEIHEVINGLELAVVDYIERFGATEKAKIALRMVDIYRNQTRAINPPA